MGRIDEYKWLLDIETDSNGYSESIIGAETDHCFLCGNTDTENLIRHELFRGHNRKMSKLFGLWIALCPKCHDMCHAPSFSDELHKIGQVIFEKTYPEISFQEVFERSYR